MTTPCPTKVQCECLDEPIENLSGEGPDNPSFLGMFRPPYTPKIGEQFQSKGCVRWCFSEVSQEEADLCAQHQAEECMAEEEVFYSDTKTCEIICPSGLGISHTVEAGTVISSISQADADARAEAVACRKASLGACSGVIPTVGNQAQGISCIDGQDLIAHVELPSNLSISGPTLTVAANSFSASTQAAANALAAQYVTDFMNAGLTSGDLTCEVCFFDEDCEGSGTPAGWTDAGIVVGGSDVDWDYTGIVLDGSQSLLLHRGPFTAPNTQFDFGPADELWLRFRMQFNVVSRLVVNFADTSFGSGCFLELLVDGRLQIDNGATQAATVDVMSAGVMYNVWVHVRKEPAGIVEVGFSTSDTEPISGNNYAALAQGTGLAILRINFSTLANNTDTVLDDLKCCAHAIGDF